MADVVVALTPLVPGTPSADLLGSGEAVTTGQTVEIEASRTEDVVLIIQETAAAAATLVFDEGPEPPSMRAGLGATDVVLAASDVKAHILEGGRYVQVDGKITATLTGAARIWALRVGRAGS